MGKSINLKSSAKLKVKDLIKKAYSVRSNDLLSSIKLAKEAIKIAGTRDKDLQAHALNALAFFYMIQCNYAESNKLSEQALTYFERQGNKKGIADAKFNIASICYKTDQFHEGLLLLLDCQTIYRQLKEYAKEAYVLKSIGTIYEYLGDVKSAILIYKESSATAKKARNSDIESNAYNPLSGIYLNQGKIDEALVLIEKSLKLKEATNDLRGVGFALYGRGKIYIETCQFNKAEHDFLKSKQIHIDAGDKVGLCMTYNKLGMLYFKMKKFDDSLHALNNALGIATEFNIIAIKYKVFNNLYLIAKEKGDEKNALNYLEKYISIKETIINRHALNVIKSYKAIARVDALEQDAKLQSEKTEIIVKKNLELDSFFYRVSHDLKGPINSLEGLNNLINHDIHDKVSLNYFTMYKKQINRISKIVMDLIELTRMNHQKMNKKLINFDLIVSECISSYHYFKNYKAISFIKKIDQQVEFYSEWPVINTILQNLIENGIKYAKSDIDRPHVTISISEEDEKIIIETSDNGLGIEPKYQNKIFDMFYRANENIDGTGLGLYIMKRAVERLNGSITLKSELGVGSSFIVQLPK